MLFWKLLDRGKTPSLALPARRARAVRYSQSALRSSVQPLLCCLQSRFWEAAGQRLLPRILPEPGAGCQVRAELPAPPLAAGLAGAGCLGKGRDFRGAVDGKSALRWQRKGCPGPCVLPVLRCKRLSWEVSSLRCLTGVAGIGALKGGNRGGMCGGHFRL